MMKNKIISFMILLGLIFGNYINVSARAAAESSTRESYAFIDIGENEATVTFADLGFRETSLISPYDATRLFFSIPPNWQLTTGGSIQLEYEVSLTGADAALIGTEQNPFGGALTVSFNDQVIGTIALNELGPQSMQMEIPANALTTARQDGRHQVTVALGGQFSCIYDIRAVVVIRPTSTMRLPFEVSSPEINLSRLPAPFYLRNSLVPDTTVVVVPNEPDATELKAALNVMAGFGSLIGSEADLGLVTTSELTEDTLGASNLIFVGRPEQFDLLGDISFPLAVQNNAFVNLPPDSETDGVVQMAISPWNESKVAMFVGGSDSEAVLKAAQAVSSGKILVYEDPTLAYVANVQLLADTLPAVQDFTLQSLGYESETLTGIGVESIQYSFNASKEQLRSPDAYINLMYYHSGLLDYGASSFTVELNSQAISSVAFNKESEQLTTLQIKIPTGILRFGENRLSISARLLATTSCDSTGFSNPWLTISDQTGIHLPATVGADTDTPALLDLKFYPNLFTTQSDLGDVAFVLPRDNPSTWKIAGRMAYDLGSAANPLIANIDGVFADDIPQPVLGGNSLIVIGRSSTIPLISEINNQLPAPFDLATDTASESNMQIVYRVPAGMSVGYLELLPSPYNQEKPILVLAGNTDDGVQLAGNALLQPELTTQLTGVFAVTNGTQIATGSSSSPFSVVGTLVPPDQAVVNTPVPAASAPPAAAEAPNWLFPLLIASGIAVLLIIGLVIISAIARARAEKAAPFHPKSNGNGNGHTH
ncbi:MAG TPA: cellulose biosynthesis cyclic di-GMP-binding regulatory protein BcsB [Anaerolineales bacterium]|nr:cellulose biosynthesis cyclic di-GMP-binding regulatory protein BcsB [Anaerolineales bacterium]